MKLKNVFAAGENIIHREVRRAPERASQSARDIFVVQSTFLIFLQKLLVAKIFFYCNLFLSLQYKGFTGRANTFDKLNQASN